MNFFIKNLIYKLLNEAKQVMVTYKPFLNFLFIVVVLLFLGLTFYRNWQEVKEIKITSSSMFLIGISTVFIQVSYLIASLVWARLLRDLGQPVNSCWATHTFLTTNIAKYLPSNLLHLYGRIIAATEIGIPTGIASLSLILESLLMVASGLLVGLISLPDSKLIVALICLVVVLLLMHPFSLRMAMGKILQYIGKSPEEIKDAVDRIRYYPVVTLFGQLLYIILRGIGFVLTLAVLTNVPMHLIPGLISAASVAWLVGFITPGLPAGIGVFELTLITLLSYNPSFLTESSLSIGIVLSSVALYRLVITLADGLSAGLAWMSRCLPLRNVPIY